MRASSDERCPSIRAGFYSTAAAAPSGVASLFNDKLFILLGSVLLSYDPPCPSVGRTVGLSVTFS